MSIHVIGVGTRQGDDAAGLAVAERLGASLGGAVRVLACERGVDLLDALAGARVAVIVDALRSGDRPGRVRRLAPETLARGAMLSSHGFGVAEALALAASLGRAPHVVEVVAIEAGAARHGALSPAVQAGVIEASVLVAELVARSAAAAEG